MPNKVSYKKYIPTVASDTRILKAHYFRLVKVLELQTTSKLEALTTLTLKQPFSLKLNSKLKCWAFNLK